MNSDRGKTMSDQERELCHSKTHDCAVVVEHPVWGMGKPLYESHAIVFLLSEFIYDIIYKMLEFPQFMQEVLKHLHGCFFFLTLAD
jgi:hypothetical protein